MKLVIISGRSGSGKSIALRVLEELGYYCVDNIPLTMVFALLKQLEKTNSLVAISLDVRNLLDQETALKQHLAVLPKDINITSIFLDSSDLVLIKRYSETRRLHPLSKGGMPLTEALKLERKLLNYISEWVDHFIDTSRLNIYELSDKIHELLGNKNNKLMIHLRSFGFKYGLPEVADFLFDCRFLPNPHWETELRTSTGLDPEIQEFLSAKPIVKKYIDQLEELFLDWLPHLEKNNRSYLTIAVGCTGGKHRSIYVVEELAKRLKNYQVIKNHSGIEL